MCIIEVSMHYYYTIPFIHQFNNRRRYNEKAPLVYHSAIVRYTLQVQVRVRVQVQHRVSSILRYIHISFCLNHPIPSYLILYCAMLCWSVLLDPSLHRTAPQRTRIERKKENNPRSRNVLRCSLRCGRVRCGAALHPASSSTSSHSVSPPLTLPLVAPLCLHSIPPPH